MTNLIIRDIDNNIHKVSSFRELAKKLNNEQHIEILNSNLERITKKYIEFTRMGSKIVDLLVY